MARPKSSLVLVITSTLLAHMLYALRFELASTPKPSPDKPLPMTLNQLTLDFAGTAGGVYPVARVWARVTPARLQPCR